MFGKIEEFDEEKEWAQYVERLGNFFSANNVTEVDRKRAIFLTVISPAAYKLLSSLISPAKPTEKTFAKLVVMKQHHNPKPFKFNSRFQQQRESIAKFVSELRSLAEFCDFGETLEVMLHDRIVCGVSESSVQRRLLLEENLSFKKAMDLALGMEAAVKNMQAIQQTSPHSKASAMSACGHRSTPGPRTAGVAAGYHCDILVTGTTEEEHVTVLEEVLTRLENAGLRLKKSKCRFMTASVVYLGHRIDA